MKQQQQTLRTAAVALFAVAAFVHAPVFGQAAPAVAPPPPVQVAPPPPDAITPPAVTPAPTPAPRAAPAEPSAAAPAPPARQTARQAPRTVERTTRMALRPAPAPVATPAAPAPEGAAPAPAPATETLPPPAVPAEPVPAGGGVAVAASDSSTSTWLALAGLALVVALAGFFLLRRRRTVEEGYYNAAYEEPALVAEPAQTVTDEYQPALVAPAFRRAAPVAEPVAAAAATGMALSEAERADMEALSAASIPEGHRPWLEFLMRPVRAGTTHNEALIEFELTVGNTGTVSAEDVRISAWMLAGRESSEMENALIEPPAGAATSETRIPAGDGAKVDATIALPRARLRDDVLPVVVADARYRLRGGGEGRTSARFAVGLPSGDGLAPFGVALGAGLRYDVEARLDGEPEHI